MRFPVLMGGVLLFTCWQTSASPLLDAADSTYAHRGDGFDQVTMSADTAIINRALDLYRQAAAEASGSAREEALWKLLRAYWFKGSYAAADRERKKTIFDEGKEIGLEAVREFPDSPGVNLWLAALWGSWAEVYGKMKAAKKGVAGKIRQLCEKVIELDPRFNDAGGYRVLGRLHFKSPKIPLILGWPSKKKAVEYLQKADEIAPGNLFTKLYLAEALYKRKERDRAVQILKEILTTEGTIIGTVEDAYIKKEAEEDLREWQVEK